MRRHQQNENEENVDLDVFHRHSPTSEFPQPPPPQLHHSNHSNYSNISSYDEYRGRPVADFSRPMRPPQQPYLEEYGNAPSPSWGPTHVSRYSQQSFETPIQSRSASPTLVSGRATPMDRIPRPKNNMDSWPNTPMVRIECFCPERFAQLPFGLDTNLSFSACSTRAMSASLLCFPMLLLPSWPRTGLRKATSLACTTVTMPKPGRDGSVSSSVLYLYSPSSTRPCT